VDGYLRDDDWNFERIEGRDAIRCGIKAKNASFRMIFDVKEDAEQLILLAISPNNVPEDKRLVAAEFITRANYGLRIGNFELDMNDGEIRYKVAIDVEGSSLSPQMLRNMIGLGVGTLDRYFPGLMAICFTGQSALEAVQQIEKK
jgi:hypothetical protein